MRERTPTILVAAADPGERAAAAGWLREAGHDVAEHFMPQDLARAAVVVADAQSPLLETLAASQPAVLVFGSLPPQVRLPAPHACLDRPLSRGSLVSVIGLLLRAVGETPARDSASEATAARAHLDSEVAKNERYARNGPALPVTAQLYGASPLREHGPDAFEDFVGRYAGLLDKAVESREYVVHHPISEQLRALGDDLGFLGAGPRDVMDVHNETLRRKRSGAAFEKGPVYVEEGRFLVLELMGHLANHYRKYAFGAARASARERSKTRSLEEDRHG